MDIRARLLTQREEYSEKIIKGEYLDENDIDRIATKLRDTLTWDALFFMIDDSILEYLDIKETHYGETAGNEPAATYEKNRNQFTIVDLISPSWTIQVPIRKKK